MKTILIPPSKVPKRFGSYQRHVIEDGHMPGVLSGAELKGKAKLWSARYAQHRRDVANMMWRYYRINVGSILTKDTRRWVRVWSDSHGNPVRLVIADPPTIAIDYKKISTAIAAETQATMTSGRIPRFTLPMDGAPERSSCSLFRAHKTRLSCPGFRPR